MRKSGIVIALCVLSLSGCAGKMDAQRGLSEEWRLRSLEENFLNFKESQREQEERSRDQQRKLQDRMRVLEESLARLQERQDPGHAVAAPSSAVPSPSASVSPAAPAPASPAAPSAIKPSSAQQSFVSPPPAYSGKGLYDQGMTLVRAEKGEEGRALLEKFLATDPKSALVPNGIYWIGESYYLEKNYPQAILTFKEVTRRFPKHHKAAAALYKIGLCYQMMGEPENATLYLRALLKDHPKSEPAPAARKLLTELGG
ncbi:tol-pal system protein YbgF [Humidesulfovibrio mexicanus]|uniref:Tol-pal system protein YbgF n=2 Tax=Humidesulfovibrio mexicanus TaxID=147047 RepID=A0A238ZFT3_9BACT|nr:tol-pal system protein YbgF [Humidesulfovibrio mexicanus]